MYRTIAICFVAAALAVEPEASVSSAVGRQALALQRCLKEQATGTWEMSTNAAQQSVSRLAGIISKVPLQRRLTECGLTCEWSDANSKCESPMAELAQKYMSCQSKASGACSGDCQWHSDDNKCELNSALMMQAMSSGAGGANNPMAQLAQKAMECSSKTSGACSGDCEWKTGEKKCDVSGTLMMQTMMGAAGGANNPMAELMQKAMECSSKTSGACSGDCEWKADENKCDLNGAFATQAMMGAAGVACNPMAEMMQKAMECQSKTSGACSGDCKWSPDNNECDLDETKAIQGFIKAGNDCGMCTTKSTCATCQRADVSYSKPFTIVTTVLVTVFGAIVALF